MCESEELVTAQEWAVFWIKEDIAYILLEGNEEGVFWDLSQRQGIPDLQDPLSQDLLTSLFCSNTGLVDKPGIWVFEGTCTCDKELTVESMEFTGTWREPTPTELVRIAAAEENWRDSCQENQKSP